MALIIPPGYLHAVYEFALAGDLETIVTTCGHELDSVSGANGVDSPDDLFNAFATNVMPGINNQYTLTGVTSYVGNDGPTPNIYTSSETPVVGGGSAIPLPQNCSWLVRKRTDLAGRRGRGRMYWPGVAEGNVGATGVIDGATVTAQQTRCDAWYAALTTAVGARYYPPVVLHRSEGIGEEPLPTPITTFVMDNRIATQRRRLRP
jgi:hypothetical protein